MEAKINIRLRHLLNFHCLAYVRLFYTFLKLLPIDPKMILLLLGGVIEELTFLWFY